jgi:hypothetical protein
VAGAHHLLPPEVQVASAVGGMVAVRDYKEPDGPTLVFKTDFRGYRGAFSGEQAKILVFLRNMEAVA